MKELFRPLHCAVLNASTILVIDSLVGVVAVQYPLSDGGYSILVNASISYNVFGDFRTAILATPEFIGVVNSSYVVIGSGQSDMPMALLDMEESEVKALDVGVEQVSRYYYAVIF